ncbi:type II secretion system minor pseudopilin GspH [Neptunicella sp. SCSIO 80796]|uniref:type II secretion system minor pseudopilin GspH n=1 Tax=Neptunicella plasticusilytica TaxID=3117012 RepID=UPI003A4E1336
MHSNSQRGFTLLEIMVVLLIIGISVSVVMLNVRGVDQADELKKQAQRFQVVFSMAAEYAILNQQQLGLRIDQNQYYFMILDEEQKWQKVTNNDLLAEYSLPEPFSLELELDDLPWQEEESLFDGKLFDEKSSFDEDQLSIGEKEEEKKLPPPQVWLLSSGDITPFSLNFIFEPAYGQEQPTYFSVEAQDALPLIFNGPLDSL